MRQRGHREACSLGRFGAGPGDPLGNLGRLGPGGPHYLGCVSSHLAHVDSFGSSDSKAEWILLSLLRD